MPASPYPSCREPTRTVMLTVIVGREASGKRRTRAPLPNRYSVTPSTLAIFRGSSAARAAVTKSKRITRDRNRRMRDLTFLEEPYRVAYRRLGHSLIRIIHEWTVSWQKYAFQGNWPSQTANLPPRPPMQGAGYDPPAHGHRKH